MFFLNTVVFFPLILSLFNCVVNENVDFVDTFQKIFYVNDERIESVLDTTDGGVLVNMFGSKATYLIKLDSKGEIVWSRELISSGVVVLDLNLVEIRDGFYFLYNEKDGWPILISMNKDDGSVIFQKKITYSGYSSDGMDCRIILAKNDYGMMIICEGIILCGVLCEEKTNLILKFDSSGSLQWNRFLTLDCPRGYSGEVNVPAGSVEVDDGVLIIDTLECMVTNPTGNSMDSHSEATPYIMKIKDDGNLLYVHVFEDYKFIEKVFADSYGSLILTFKNSTNYNFEVYKMNHDLSQVVWSFTYPYITNRNRYLIFPIKEISEKYVNEGAYMGLFGYIDPSVMYNAIFSISMDGETVLSSKSADNNIGSMGDCVNDFPHKFVNYSLSLCGMKDKQTAVLVRLNPSGNTCGLNDFDFPLFTVRKGRELKISKSSLTHTYTTKSVTIQDTNIFSAPSRLVSSLSLCSLCIKGHYGDYCNDSTYDCFGLLSNETQVCSSHGSCISTDYCKCDSHYYGLLCNITSCNGYFNNDSSSSYRICDGHGSCRIYNNCSCDGGYMGEYCGEYGCFGLLPEDPKVCSHHGTCISPDKCKCEMGYAISSDCSLWTCSGILSSSERVCHGFGQCVSLDNCSCQNYYSGQDCEIWCCFGVKNTETENRICSGHGSCVSHDNCICTNSDQYFGRNCSEWKCYGIGRKETTVCSQRGQCVDFDTCKCDENYWNTKCQSPQCQKDFNNYLMMKEEDDDNIYDGDDIQSRYEKVIRPLFGEEGKFQMFLVSRENPDQDVHLIYKGGMKGEMKHGVGFEYFFDPNSTRTRKKKKKKLYEDDFNYGMDHRPILSYEGAFRNGVRHGIGVQFSHLGDRSYQGKWVNGKLSEIINHEMDLKEIHLEDLRPRVKIGDGTEGDVFKVKIGKNEVAVKILKKRKAGARDRLRIRERLVNSTIIWNKISDHPYILDLLGWSGLPDTRDNNINNNKDDRELGYVMKLCERSLADVFWKGEQIMDMESRVLILFQIAEAMAHLHKLSIMHRDLKLQNVLLDEFNRPQICDFEFTKYDEVDYKYFASNETALGTMVYLPPEIIERKSYTKRCDVYSYGILVYSVYYGVVDPYSEVKRCSGCGREINFLKDFSRHVSDCSLRPPLHPKTRNIQDPKGEYRWLVTELMKKCVLKDPKKRISFEEIVLFLLERKKNVRIKKEIKRKNVKHEEEEEGEEDNLGVYLNVSSSYSINDE